jgi:hypothetical protein
MTVFGGQLGAGVDFELSRHFMLGLSLKYNLMSDFHEINVGRRNYSGFECCLGIGFAWGESPGPDGRN